VSSAGRDTVRGGAFFLERAIDRDDSRSEN
jgi:hypothetical protein